jgi:hypothetical protein
LNESVRRNLENGVESPHNASFVADHAS